MTDQKLLIGSLSNDLMRVATLTQRGSLKAAAKFLDQAKKWCLELSLNPDKPYIKKIINEVVLLKSDHLDEAQAERFLTYSILLQNHSLNLK